MKHTAESWNAAHPVGTRVRYWPILPATPPHAPRETVTRSEAWTLQGGHILVMIVGVSGGVHLSHVEALEGGT